MKECYFGVSGVKAKEVTNGFEHIFQEYLCVFPFLEPGACFEYEGSRDVLCIFS